MSVEKTSFHFNSIIPETCRSKAEAFARCLHDKLISLGSVAGFTGSNEDYISGSDVLAESNAQSVSENAKCPCTGIVKGENKERLLVEGVKIRLTEDEAVLLDNMLSYDVPYRVLRESSSTSSLDKHFSNNLYSTKRLSRSGCTLSERLTDESIVEDGYEEATRENCLLQGEKTEKPLQLGDAPAICITQMNELETDSQMKLRRCSSLKTWKTPPGTPGEKKIVRFADALGLDLADVRTFLDEIPKIPSSAYEALHFTDISPVRPPIPTLMPKFIQPGTQIDFLERVKNMCVSLESAILTDTAVLTVSGCVRVRSIAYEKAVYIRYTVDNWTTFSDLQATYISNSYDGFSDMFSFVLYGHTLKIGGKLEFAIRFDCNGVQYWDNNDGKNYVLECLPQSPLTSQLTDEPLNPVETTYEWADFY